MFRQQNHKATHEGNSQKARTGLSKRLALGFGLAVLIVVAGGLVWWRARPASSPPLTPLQLEQVPDDVRKQADTTDSSANSYPKGSEEWLNIMLNNAIFYADNHACEHAKDTMNQVKQQKPDDYSWVEKRISKACP